MADNRLVEPKNALVKQYRRLFEMEGIARLSKRHWSASPAKR
jgi:ATP-dependent protease Clp ATPase subunit